MKQTIRRISSLARFSANSPYVDDCFVMPLSMVLLFAASFACTTSAFASAYRDLGQRTNLAMRSIFNSSFCIVFIMATLVGCAVLPAGIDNLGSVSLLSSPAMADITVLSKHHAFSLSYNTNSDEAFEAAKSQFATLYLKNSGPIVVEVGVSDWISHDQFKSMRKIRILPGERVRAFYGPLSRCVVRMLQKRSDTVNLHLDLEGVHPLSSTSKILIAASWGAP